MIQIRRSKNRARPRVPASPHRWHVRDGVHQWTFATFEDARYFAIQAADPWAGIHYPIAGLIAVQPRKLEEK